MKKMLFLVFVLACFGQKSTAQMQDIESLKRSPHAKMRPNQPVPRDSSVLFIINNKVYNSWDPNLMSLMKTKVLDTSKYYMTIYSNPKSETVVKNVMIFQEKKIQP